MARIFLVLAAFASLLLLANLLYAFAIGDFGAASRRYSQARRELQALEAQPDVELAEVERQHAELAALAEALRVQRERFWPHVWLGIVASLVSLLVNSISVTYFIGTSRWCREVVEAYGMPTELALASQRLKRRSFPWALMGIVGTLAIAGLGAAADPYASTADPASWVTWHMTAALLGVVLIIAAFVVQVGTVAANYEVIQKILAEAERMRSG